MSDELAKALRVPHPLKAGALYPASTVLSDLAGQEGCDGEPYDTMQRVADALRAALTAYEAQAKAPPSAVEKTLAELDAKLIESLDDLMRGAENYFSTENPKRKGQIAASAKRINAQIVTPLRSHIASLVKERDEARRMLAALAEDRMADLQKNMAPVNEARERSVAHLLIASVQADEIATLGNELAAAQADAARMREALKDLLETAVEPDTDSELYHCNLKRKAARAALNPETPDAK